MNQDLKTYKLGTRNQKRIYELGTNNYKHMKLGTRKRRIYNQETGTKKCKTRKHGNGIRNIYELGTRNQTQKELGTRN